MVESYIDYDLGFTNWDDYMMAFSHSLMSYGYFQRYPVLARGHRLFKNRLVEFHASIIKKLVDNGEDINLGFKMFIITVIHSLRKRELDLFVLRMTDVYFSFGARSFPAYALFAECYGTMFIQDIRETFYNRALFIDYLAERGLLTIDSFKKDEELYETYKFAQPFDYKKGEYPLDMMNYFAGGLKFCSKFLMSL